MVRWWRDLDRILRGEVTRPSDLRRGGVDVPAGGLSIVLVVLGMIYGICMGSFALFRGGGTAIMQVVASMLKVPALFFLTLVVTFPSLYVFNALVGSRLSPSSVLRLLVASLGVTMAVLASLGPIVAFFSASTTSYAFMILLNVAVYGVSGLLGLTFLLRTLHRLVTARDELPAPAPTEVEEVVGEDKVISPGALEPLGDRVLGRHERVVFRCWVVVFGIVGAQMGWVLRPFIGSPDLPFAWFRPRESNVFEAILGALGNLFA